MRKDSATSGREMCRFLFAALYLSGRDLRIYRSTPYCAVPCMLTVRLEKVWMPVIVYSRACTMSRVPMHAEQCVC